MTPTVAEFRALLGDPHVHLFLAGSVVLALVGAFTTSPAFLSGVLLAVCAAIVTARDLYEGTVADTLTRVPDRARYLLARVAAAAVLTAGVTILFTVVSAGFGGSLAVAAVEGPATVLLTVQAVCLGLLARRPALVAPILVALWFVLPTALRALGVYLGAHPGDGGVMATVMGWLSPLTLAADAAGWSLVRPEPGQEDTWAEAVRGAVGLVTWTAALLAAAWAWLRRHDF